MWSSMVFITLCLKTKQNSFFPNKTLFPLHLNFTNVFHNFWLQTFWKLNFIFLTFTFFSFFEKLFCCSVTVFCSHLYEVFYCCAWTHLWQQGVILLCVDIDVSVKNPWQFPLINKLVVTFVIPPKLGREKGCYSAVVKVFKEYPYFS